MAANNILPFGDTASGTNILTQAAYSADTQRSIGHQPGIARQELENKVLRQVSAVAAGVAQYLAANQSTDIVDTMTPTQFAVAFGAAIGGRYLRSVAIGTSGTYTPGAGARTGILEIQGAGGGGAGSSTASGTQVSAGSGGGAGSYIRHVIATLAVQAVQVGAPGAGGGVGVSGATGGATTFGSLIAPGGNGGQVGLSAPPWITRGGDPGNVATGGNLFNSKGAQGGNSMALGLSAFSSGAGAPSVFGGGGPGLVTTSIGGNAAEAYGAGGGGGLNGQSTPGQVGGNGGGGLIVIHEYGGV